MKNPNKRSIPSQFKLAQPDARAWLGVKNAAMTPADQSQYLASARSGQGLKNLAAMDAMNKKSPWGAMPTGEAAMGSALSQGIGGQAQAFMGQAAADVGLQRGAEEQRAGFEKMAPQAFEQSQAANKFNMDVANKMQDIENLRLQKEYERKGKVGASDILANQYRMGGE